MTHRGSFGAALGWLLLAALLVFYGAGGRYLPYLTLLLSLTAVPYLIAVRAGRPLIPDFPSRGFLIAFGLLAAAFALSAKQPGDILIIANFGWLLLFVPMQSLFKRLAWPGSAVVIARLALAGVAITLLMAGYEAIWLGAERAGYVTSDAIRIANTAVILGSLALIGFVADRGPMRAIYLLGPLLAIAVALLAGTRGAIAAQCVLALIAGPLMVRTTRIAMLVTLCLVVLSAATFGAALLLHIPRVESLVLTVRDVLSGHSVSDPSAQVRLAMIGASWGAFLDSPWFGHGWQHMMSAIVPHLPPGQETISAGQPHLHNDIADFAVAGGILGLLAYATILLTPVVAAVRSVRDSLYRPRLLAILIVVAAYATLGINSLMFGYEIHTALYCGLCAIILGYCRETTSVEAEDATAVPQSSGPPGRIERTVAAVLIILTLVLSTVIGLVTPYIIVAIGLCLFVWMLFSGRLPASYTPPASKLLLIAFALLALLFTLTMQAARDPVFAFNFTMLFLFGPLAWLFARVADRWNVVRISTLAAIGVGVTLVMVLYTMGRGDPRPVGLNIGPIVLSNAALALSVVATMGAIAARSRRALLLPLAIAAAIATALITQSRGPLVAVAPLLVLTLFMLWRVRFRNNWRAILIVGVVIGLGIVAAALLGNERFARLPEMISGLLAGGETSDYTTNIRLALYDAGWRAFLDAPWFGHGWARLMSSAIPYVDPQYLEVAKTLPQLHNDVLNFAVSGGVVGVGIYLLIIATPTIVALRSVRDSLWAARVYGTAGLMIVYLGGGVTDLMFGHEFHTAFYVVLNAIVLSFARGSDAPAHRQAVA